MSEAMEQIQTSSPNELPGGQTPEEILAADLRSRQGHNFPQNTTSICRGVEVPASSQTSDRKFSPGLVNGISEPNREPATVSGMTVDGRVAEAAKPVAAHHLEGSNQGDHRSKASPASLPPNPGPRQGMTQAPFGGKQ